MRLTCLLLASSVNALNTFATKQSPPSLRSTVESTAFIIDTSLISPTAAKVENFFATQIPIATKEKSEHQEQHQKSPCLATTELLGEFLGTGWTVGAGIMASSLSTFVDPFSAAITLPETALACSLAVTVAIYMTTSVFKWGDAHFNPAITLAMALFRQMDRRKVVPYSLAQIAGSTMGSAVSYSLMADAIQSYETDQGLIRASSMETARVFGAEYFDASSLSMAQAFGFEALGTAVLTATAFAMTHPSRQSQLPVPAIMGATVFSLINALAPLTQAVGMNPARDFGPRLVAFAAGWTDVAFQDCWVYMLAPLVGATSGAAFVDKVAFAASADENQEDDSSL